MELAASAAISLFEFGFFVVTELRPGLRPYGYGMHWDTHCVGFLIYLTFFSDVNIVIPLFSFLSILLSNLIPISVSKNAQSFEHWYPICGCIFAYRYNFSEYPYRNMRGLRYYWPMTTVSDPPGPRA